MFKYLLRLIFFLLTNVIALDFLHLIILKISSIPNHTHEINILMSNTLQFTTNYIFIINQFILNNRFKFSVDLIFV